MEEQLARLRSACRDRLAAARTSAELEQVRIEFLARKGALAKLIDELPRTDPALRPRLGRLANEVKQELTAALAARQQELAAPAPGTAAAPVDITLPGKRVWQGSEHPITLVTDEILRIFCGMGFREELGPEIETDWYNFEALNMRASHPARDMFASFYLGPGRLLRSHTSPVQIHTMERQPPPVRIVAPGRVFRRDPFDASHSPVFHQVEGLYVDRDVSFADLKGTLATFCKEMFGAATRVRFAPSYFPFTEPSADISISCAICDGAGCQVCRNSGWIEILGAGMVHPTVLENVKYDPTRYSGFAFGMGVERIAIVKYRIDDIRLFYENDIRFLEQFS